MTFHAKPATRSRMSRMEAGFEHLRETMADILTQAVEFPQVFCDRA